MAMHPVKEIVTDATGFGGLPVYLAAAFLLAFYDSSQAVRLLVALVVVYALAFAIRMLYFRQRPDRSKVRSLSDRFFQSSFPSVHAMRSAALAILLMFYFRSFPIQVFLGCLVAITGFSRVYLKRHYVSDVLAGVALGAVISVILGVYF